MADHQKNDYTLEEILAEQRSKKDSANKETAQVPADNSDGQNLPVTDVSSQLIPPVMPQPQPNVSVPQNPEAATEAAPVSQQPAPAAKEPNMPAAQEAPSSNVNGNTLPLTDLYSSQGTPVQQQAPMPAKQVRPTAPKPANPQQAFLATSGENDNSATEDLNLYATGNIKAADIDDSPKKRKGIFGWFGKNKKKKVPDFNESEDMFYGLQLKPIDEYRKGYNNTGEFNIPQDTYADLFDQSKEDIDDGVAENFRRLQEERRQRMQQAMESSGMNEADVENEFGIVAPMPITSFAADPYARQHGMAVEGTAAGEDGLADFQRAQLENSDQTMQIKLNIMNDTVELESLQNMPSVSDASVERILAAAPKQAPLFADEDATKEIPAIPYGMHYSETITPVQHNTAPQMPQQPVAQVPYQENIPVQQNVAPQIPQQPVAQVPYQEIAPVQQNVAPQVPQQPAAQISYQENVPVQQNVAPQVPQQPVTQVPYQENVAPVQQNVAPQVPQQPVTQVPYQENIPVQQNVAPQMPQEPVVQVPYQEIAPVQQNVAPQVPQQPVAQVPYQENVAPVQQNVAPQVPQQPAAQIPYQEIAPVQQNVAPQVPQQPVAQVPYQEIVPVQQNAAPQVPQQPVRQNIPMVSADGAPIAMPNEKPVKRTIADKVVPPQTTERPVIPAVKSPFEYREKGVPMHVLNTDVSQALNFATPTAPSSFADKTVKKIQEMASGKAKTEENQANPATSAAPNPMDTKPVVNKTPLFKSPVQEQPESIDDYTSPDDTRSITNELKADMYDLTLRMMITGAATLILIFVNLVFGHSLSAEAPSSTIIYAALTLIFLSAAVVGCFRTVLNGLKSLIEFNANSDSGIAVAVIGVFVQTLFGLIFKDALVSGSLRMYAVVVTGALFVNAAGKLTMIRRIHSNFRFVTSREQKYGVNLFDDHNVALKMTKNVVSDRPVLAYQTKTGFLRRFLEISYRPDPSEMSSQMLAPIGVIASLVLCVVCMLVTKSVPMAINSLAASLIVSTAIGNMISINLPMSRLSKLARRAGAMVSGYEAVRLAGDVNAVMMDAADLFPKGTVVLDGIKTYTHNREMVEETIVCASALMCEAGGPLTGVFEQVIMEKEDHLPDVAHYLYEDEFGMVGQVDGKTIYIGNRGLLIKNKIEPPAREDESPYAASNKQIIYVAQDNTVVAMLILSYTADRRRKNELHRMEDNGIGIVIRTTDPSVTPQFVGRLFNVDPHIISVLDSSLSHVYDGLTAKELPRSDATIATKGRIESLMTVLAACVGSKRDVNFIVALQTIGVVLGFLLVAFLSCFGTISKLSSFLLFSIELVWLILVLILPRMRKP